MKRIHLSTAGLALTAALTLSACGGVADETDAASESSSPSATTSEEPTSAPTSEPTSAPTSESTASETPTPEPEPTSEAPAGPTLDVTVAGNDVSPNAESIDLGVGEPLTITIESDRAGEFHVHSSPEQYVEFDAGSTTTELVVETPGEVEVEEHDTGAVVAVLTVS